MRFALTAASKVCTKCGKETALFDMHPDKRRTDGVGSWCKGCHSDSQRVYYRNNRERILDYWRHDYRPNNRALINERARNYSARNKDQIRRRGMERKYGLPYEKIEKMYADQGYGCAICGTMSPLDEMAIDHCHSSGRVRGILCPVHNTMIGMGGDSATMMYAGYSYLMERQ